MYILGISAFYHDSAAVLVEDGKLVAAAQEERFSRLKHDARFPGHAISYCLSEAGIGPAELDSIVFYDKPFLKFERLIETYLSFAPRGLRSFQMSIPLWVREKLFQRRLLSKRLKEIFGKDLDWQQRLLFSEHHLSHAASAYYPSPFEEAAVLTMDGVGEWATTSLACGSGSRLQIVKEIHFPHSLGLLYSAFTYYAGFKVNSGEYKLMGLAPYGQPRFTQLILDNLIQVKADGSFRVNQKYFDYCTGLRMTSQAFDELFGASPRKPDEPINQIHLDVAASIQNVLEEVVLRMTRSIAAETGHKNLCLAGGVALNCVANGKILRDGAFRNIWIQPASGDAGGAAGAALAAYYQYRDQPRAVTEGDSMQGGYLGPSFSQREIEDRLSEAGARFNVLDNIQLRERCVDALVEGKALGWFQGRMEFGPPALGARSILADARSPTMQLFLNLKVKNRESFRPFAPSILREDVGDWFELDCDSPYMLLTAKVAAEHRRELTSAEQARTGLNRLNAVRSDIPAATHVDYSARIQTVSPETNPSYYQLISAFKQRTGCPVIINTSFNIRGEPIVATPEEAFRCFMGTGIDTLAIGDCFLVKEEQDAALKRDLSSIFEPD
ncbi:MAG: carbamoyltransferase [Acidobacteriota bacterium]|nr:carbamoyltransferase [Acidobacteriota bacterium]